MNISGTPEKLGQYLAQRIEQMVRPAFYLLQDLLLVLKKEKKKIVLLA